MFQNFCDQFHTHNGTAFAVLFQGGNNLLVFFIYQCIIAAKGMKKNYVEKADKF